MSAIRQEKKIIGRTIRREELKQSSFINKMISYIKTQQNQQTSGTTKTVEQIYQIQDQLEKNQQHFCAPGKTNQKMV